MKWGSLLLTFLFTFASAFTMLTQAPAWIPLSLALIGGLAAINFVCASFRDEFRRVNHVIDRDE